MSPEIFELPPVLVADIFRVPPIELDDAATEVTGEFVTSAVATWQSPFGSLQVSLKESIVSANECVAVIRRKADAPTNAEKLSFISRLAKNL